MPAKGRQGSNTWVRGTREGGEVMGALAQEEARE